MDESDCPNTFLTGSSVGGQPDLRRCCTIHGARCRRLPTKATIRSDRRRFDGCWRDP
jgi:hypothetical protein